MSEKFCLSWNDFHSNASKSFKLFRDEAYLHDVTLVSDDHNKVAAHKLILSASSAYFKDIIKNNPHSHPLLCLDGISSEDLKNVMDYIYNGEVKIFQDDLDRFLVVAQRLKLEGLIHHNDNEKNNIDNSNYFLEENVQRDAKVEAILHEPDFNSTTMESKRVPRKKIVQPTGKEIVPAETQDMNEVNEKINQYLEECVDGSFKCTYCNKGSNQNYGRALQKQIIQKHIETHLGLTYTCPLCQKIFRSSNSLACHKYTVHKGIKSV